jgi:hypothetical protein
MNKPLPYMGEFAKVLFSRVHWAQLSNNYCHSSLLLDFLPLIISGTHVRNVRSVGLEETVFGPCNVTDTIASAVAPYRSP